MTWAGFPLSAAGVAGYYGDILDGMISDETDAGGVLCRVEDTLMTDDESRRVLAEETLRFAEALAS
jgi:LPPG:FO 2-phospho-L-lactate transferase